MEGLTYKSHPFSLREGQGLAKVTEEVAEPGVAHVPTAILTNADQQWQDARWHTHLRPGENELPRSSRELHTLLQKQKTVPGEVCEWGVLLMWFLQRFYNKDD